MIPKRFILEWTKFVPWQEPRQIEQDLIITKALLKIYAQPQLQQNLAFRGGTALNKLYFNPPSRYSEDIDLVQTNSEPIGKTIDGLRETMDPWLGEPKRSFSESGVTLTYRTTSEDGFPIRLKLEINSREHFSIMGLSHHSFECLSSWEQGRVDITTFPIEELLGTKMRALYQRRKGRDLYDLYIALNTLKTLDTSKILHCFREYMKFGGHNISKKLFVDNMEAKMQHTGFCGDMSPLLPTGMKMFDPQEAYAYVLEALIQHV
ncbi:TPA: nucleotidyl transferase AbiEii/AbiGii toxin family protein [Legionella pneumophila]|uniref:Nucleotidyl transferase AbiEii/AbiGii toxin family protein n=1 Tax=Legionella pneumophila TaxID=446 RepID=A0AAP3HE77_LEGPN|nr:MULTISPECIES: nucleotidyl transferase AbiEii/AbiGii toxin family protein [Legionella]HAT9433919.1 nucleotidyl transferase AbiEii/AbiGii toxin family protein [Legionella pneumophila subsp. pneumophila]ADG25715.1 hypothetical protein lpa_03398 [Legionella pneumophila 2300/99 Alcoy]MBN9226135.1 nucleotidyl transferase AbiEii/AbiGii toxin family protein [Legionella steelei]MCZ4691562.1 nucleotidyl transferase AbiEii/AbiGii toxin family protein [Legionella pneumophila]MCZ4711078.1 nucleotidyl tr